MSRIFSGIQPSGELHIGNYLGAVKNWVKLQTEFESIFCIVDYHAIITAYEPAQLKQRRRDMATRSTLSRLHQTLRPTVYGGCPKRF